MLLSVMAIAAAGLAVELMTRALGLSIGALTDPIYQPSPYPGVVYEFKANARGYTWGHTWVEANSYGFRGAEVPLEKPAHTFRIGVFGDSCTFGQGVDAQDTYASVLERSLNERLHDRDARVEVLNFGVPAYNISNIVSAFVEKGTRFDLDVAVLAVIVQDYGFDRDHKADAYGYPVHAATPIKPGLFKNTLRHLHVSYLIRDAWWRLTASGSTGSTVADAVASGNELPPPVMQRAEQELARFAGVARRVGAAPIYLNLTSATPRELNALADQDGFTRLEIAPAYAQYDAKALSVSAHDAHPSRLAHTLIANVLVDPVAQALARKQSAPNS